MRQGKIVVTPSVILVHGAWADGSSWRKVIPLLADAGLSMAAVQLPLTSLRDDAATVRRAMDLEGPSLLLVGHSYGGVVISEVGGDPKVVGLVYVAAFAPAAGESALSVGARARPSAANPEIGSDAAGFLKLTAAGVATDFAQDLDDVEQRVLIVTQGPTSEKALDDRVTTPAWRTKPSWYVLATRDRTIPPELQSMMSKRMGARVTAIPTSHVAMLAHPVAVADVIIVAAKASRPRGEDTDQCPQELLGPFVPANCQTPPPAGEPT